MSSNTTNYNLKKYEMSDKIDETILGLSDNMDIIDTNMAEFVKDNNYVHTDNNYSNDNKAKLDGLANITAIGNNLTLEDGILSATGGGGSAEGFFVLEATVENPIDFNDLTEPGIYFIKDMNTQTAPNSGYTSNTSTDLEVTVSTSYNPTNGVSVIYQHRPYTNASNIVYYRYLNSSVGTWTDWRKSTVYPSEIGAGTLAGAVKANATAVTTLTTTQVRNIQASTTDLTAGTSTLATGDIYLVYE